jgi:hypothetical protein
MKAAEAFVIATRARALDGTYKRKETDAMLEHIKVHAMTGQMSVLAYDAIDPIIVSRLYQLCGQA